MFVEELVHDLSLTHAADVLVAATNGSGEYHLGRSQDPYVKMYSFPGLRPLAGIVEESWIACVSPDGAVALTSGQQGLGVWDARARVPLKKFSTSYVSHAEKMLRKMEKAMAQRKAMFDSGELQQADDDDDYYYDDKEEEEEEAVPEAQAEAGAEADTPLELVLCAAFHPSSAFFAVGGNEGSIYIIDVASLRVVHDALFDKGDRKSSVLSLDFSPDGDRLAALTGGYTCTIFNRPSNTQSTIELTHARPALSVRFNAPHAAALTVATTSLDGSAMLWDVNAKPLKFDSALTPEQREIQQQLDKADAQRVPDPNAATAADKSPSGRYTVRVKESTSYQGVFNAAIIDVETGAKVFRIPGDFLFSALDLSYVVTYTKHPLLVQRNIAQVWDTDTHELLFMFELDNFRDHYNRKPLTAQFCTARDTVLLNVPPSDRIDAEGDRMPVPGYLGVYTLQSGGFAKVASAGGAASARFSTDGSVVMCRDESGRTSFLHSQTLKEITAEEMAALDWADIRFPGERNCYSMWRPKDDAGCVYIDSRMGNNVGFSPDDQTIINAEFYCDAGIAVVGQQNGGNWLQPRSS